jgi:biotin operon repressor
MVDTNDQVHTMFDCPDDKQEKETQDSIDPINKKDVDDFKDDYGEEDAEDVENTKNTIIYDDNLVYSHDGRVIIKNSLLKLFLMDLSASELKIMLYFVALSNNKPYRIDMNHISDCLHITERTIKKNLASLEEKGYIIKNDDDTYTIGFEEIRLPDGKVFITSVLIDSLKE